MPKGPQEFRAQGTCKMLERGDKTLSVYDEIEMMRGEGEMETKIRALSKEGVERRQRHK